MVIAADSQIAVPSWTMVGTKPLGLSLRKSGFICSLVALCHRDVFQTERQTVPSRQPLSSALVVRD